MVRILAAIAVAAGFLIIATHIVKADHNGPYLPLVPNTPAIQNLLADGERAWCTNAAAANYPSFVSQLQQTYDSQRNTLGNGNRRIQGTFESASAALSAGCEVWHNGRYDFFCSGCAANVHYASWPVTVNYKLGLGYVDWKSAQGHEEGHIHSLHEQYRDSGSIGCDNGFAAMVNRLGFATVMSCGTLVWELQEQDVIWICDLYATRGDRFHACAPEPVPEWGECFLAEDRFGQDWGGVVCWRNWSQEAFWWIPQFDGREQLWVWSERTPWHCRQDCPR